MAVVRQEVESAVQANKYNLDIPTRVTGFLGLELSEELRSAEYALRHPASYTVDFSIDFGRKTMSKSLIDRIKEARSIQASTNSETIRIDFSKREIDFLNGLFINRLIICRLQIERMLVGDEAKAFNDALEKAGGQPRRDFRRFVL